MNYHENLKQHYLDVKKRLRQNIANIAPDPAPVVKEITQFPNFAQHRRGKPDPNYILARMVNKHGFSQEDIFYGPSNVRRNIARSETVSLLLNDAGLTTNEIAKLVDMPHDRICAVKPYEFYRKDWRYRKLVSEGNKEWKARRDIIDVGTETMITAEVMIDNVCAKYNVTLRDIKSERRFPEIVKARQELYYRLFRVYLWSSVKVGRYLNKDHTTILYGAAKFKKMLDSGEASL